MLARENHFGKFVVGVSDAIIKFYDVDNQVLYIYEIQLEEEFQRKGLGRFMMQVAWSAALPFSRSFRQLVER